MDRKSGLCIVVDLSFYIIELDKRKDEYYV